jgi:hypothetical protein
MKIYVYAEWESWHHKVGYTAVSFESKIHGKCIHETEIDHPSCPDQAAIEHEAERLRARQQEIRAAAEMQCTELEGQIQSLLALPSAPL